MSRLAIKRKSKGRLRRSFLAGTVAGIVSFASTGGCFLILNDDADQCSTDSDCESRGFAYARCENRTCVNAVTILNTPEAGSVDSGDGAVASCTQNKDCTGADPSAVCLSGACVSLKGPGCNEIFPIGAEYLNDDGVLRIGILTSLSNPDTQAVGRTLLFAARTAAEEYHRFYTTQSALPSAVLIKCDEDAPFDDTVKHLLAIKVDAILGPMSEEKLFDLLPQSKAANIPVVSGLANDPRLQQGDNLAAINSGLLYSVRPNRVYETKFFASALEKTRELLEVAKPGQYGTLSAMVVVGSDASSQTFLTKLQPVLGSVVVGTYLDTGPGNETQTATAVIAKTPNIVVFASELGNEAGVIQAIEAGWTGSNKPAYFVVHRPQALLPKLTTSLPNVTVYGLTFARPADSKTAYDTFKIEYQKVAQSVPPLNAEYMYDAYSVAAFAAMGARQLRDGNPKTAGVLLGLDLQKAMGYLFLPPGETMAGNDHEKLSTAIQNLSEGSADAYGVTGRLDFDFTVEKTGSPPEDGLLFCYDPVAKTYCDTGFTFKVTDGVVQGQANTECKCP